MKTDRMTTSFKTYSFTGTSIIENPIKIQKILVNHFVIKYYCKKKKQQNTMCLETYFTRPRNAFTVLDLSPGD